MNWLKIVWLVFTGILLAFPVGFLLYWLYAWLKKVFLLMKKKFENIKALEKMKDDLLKQSAGEYMSESSDEESSEEEVDSSVSQISDPLVSNRPSFNTDPSVPQSGTAPLQGEPSRFGPPLEGGMKGGSCEQEWEVLHKEKQAKAKEEAEKKKLAEKHRQEVNKIIYQVEALKNEGKLEEYEKKIIEGLSFDPHNLVLTRKLADLYFSKQEHKKALSLLKKIIEEDPEDHSSLWQIGEIYLNNQDYQTAELLIDKAIDLNTENPKYYMSMVEVYYSTDRRLEAVQIMEKVIKLRPENPKYLQILAEIYDELGDEDNAVKYYFRLLENDPSNPKAKKRLNQ